MAHMHGCLAVPIYDHLGVGSRNFLFLLGLVPVILIATLA